MHTNKKYVANYDAVMAAPFGAVGVVIQGVQVHIDLLPQKPELKPAQNKAAQRVVDQIEAYFQNPYQDFNLPFFLKGTAFQQKVWQVISTIPCGQVLTYGEIAQMLNSGSRAVANACGANYLPLIIPCHRVVAKKGLGGFMRGVDGGIKIKQWLLKHEGVSI